MNLSKLITHPVLALIVANIIWGAAAPIFKWSLENIEPFTLAFLRFGIPTLLMLPFVRGRKMKIEEKDWAKIFLNAFLGITINIGFFLVALKLTDSINAPIIASAGVLFLIFGGMIFLKEKIRIRALVGAIIGFLGVLLIVVLPLLSNTGADSGVLGNVILIIATLASVGHVIVLKRLSGKYDIFPLLFWSFLIGSLTFIPFVFLESISHGFLPNLDMKGVLGILFGSLLASLLAHYLYYASLKQLRAFDVGVFTYLDPVIAIMIAIPLLGEIPTPVFIIGSILVFGGIYVAEKRIPWHPFHLFRKQS